MKTKPYFLGTFCIQFTHHSLSVTFITALKLQKGKLSLRPHHPAKVWLYGSTYSSPLIL